MRADLAKFKKSSSPLTDDDEGVAKKLDAADVKKMKVAELKAELTARNIPVKGMLKAALVSKLA